MEKQKVILHINSLSKLAYKDKPVRDAFLSKAVGKTVTLVPNPITKTTGRFSDHLLLLQLFVADGDALMTRIWIDYADLFYQELERSASRRVTLDTSRMNRPLGIPKGDASRLKNARQ